MLRCPPFIDIYIYIYIGAQSTGSSILKGATGLDISHIGVSQRSPEKLSRRFSPADTGPFPWLDFGVTKFRLLALQQAAKN